MLDINELKGLPVAEQLKRAGEYAGVTPQTVDGIWKTESNRGTHKTMIGPDTKWGTAKGHFQMLDGVHATIEQRVGTKLNRMDFTESLVATSELLKENMARYKDEDKAVLAYHGGTNQKNWGPVTQDYLKKVRGTAAGKPGAMPTAPPSPTGDEGTRRGAPTYEEFMAGTASPVGAPAPVEKGEKLPNSAAGPMLKPFGRDQNKISDDGVQSNFDAAAKEQSKANAQTFWGTNRETSTVGASISDALAPTASFLDKFHMAPDPVYLKAAHADPSIAFEGVENPNEMERDDLLAARSQAERGAVAFRIQTRREDSSVLSRASTAGQLAGGFVAGAVDPLTYVAGLGAMKAAYAFGVGATVLARGGRPLAAGISSVVENAAGNVGYEVFKDVMGEHRSIADYGLAAAVGMLPAGLAAPGLRREYQGFLHLQGQQALARQAPFIEKAIAQLGEDADRGAISALATKLETEHMTGRMADVRGVPEGAPTIAPDLEAAAKLSEGGETSAMAFPEREGLSDLTTKADMGHSEVEGMMLTDERMTALGSTRTAGEVKASAPGVHIDSTLTGDAWFSMAAKNLETLRAKYLPDVAIQLTRAVPQKGKVVDGYHTVLAPGHSVIALQPSSTGMWTGTHELGHAITDHYLPQLPPEISAGLRRDYLDYLSTAEPQARMGKRLGLTRGEGDTVLAGTLRGEVKDLHTSLTEALGSDGAVKYQRYFESFDEFAAEQFLKQVETDLAGAIAKGGDLTVPQQMLSAFAGLVKRLKGLWEDMTSKGLTKPGEGFQEFFRAAAGRELKSTANPQKGKVSFDEAGPATPSAPVYAPDSIEVRYGLTALTGDAAKDMERKAIVDLIRHTEAEMKANPIDRTKTKTIMESKLFSMGTPGLNLAMSNHPVAQWASRHLVENTMGGSGRHVTAAMRKAQYELEFVGNGNVLFDHAYEGWKSSRGVGTAKGTTNDMFKGDMLDTFDRLVYAEVENRRWGKASTNDQFVKNAADAHQVSYERMLDSQKRTKTVGWSVLPEDSLGYVPHHMAAAKLGTLTNARREAMRAAIEGQMVDNMGFDRDFAKKLSGAYLDHARINANGGHEIPANMHDVHAPEYVKQAAKAAGMTADEIAILGKKLAAGGASHTKKRLNLDLTKEYMDGDTTFTLMDIMDTDHRKLLKNQARRVSGEVGLTQQGVQGSGGLKLMERALQFTEDGKVDVKAVESFQQVSAEMLGRPYGDKMPTLAEGAMTANAATNLGGMAITQLTETLNMGVTLGLSHGFKGIMSLPRLIKEAKILAKGGTVEGSMLHSMELPGGEFGMTDYKLVTRYDSPSSVYDSVGRDSLSTADKVIRATGRGLGKVSMHRIVQAAQVRAAAEQITQKALKYIRDGVESKALADMGFTPELTARIRADLPNIAEFDASGRILSLDMTKAKDADAVATFITSVHRGTGQIIQRSFVGEVGKWQHSAMGKVVTQFRTFPITAMEKQWGRQRGIHGAAGAIGLVIAVAPFAVPIYLAKVALHSVGRADQDAYIEKMTSPIAVTRGVMNYVGMLGLAPDFLDMMTALPGVGDAITEAGGGAANTRAGTTGSIVPLAGYTDKVLKAIQEPSAQSIAKSLPYSNVPYLVPFINALPK